MKNPLSPEIRAQIYACRKSLTLDQERRFLDELRHHPEELKLLGQLLFVTGCRVSEALALRRDHLDTDEALVVFHTLKQQGRKRKGQRADPSSLRAVPVPQELVLRLASLPSTEDGRLWTFSRWTARRRIKAILLTAQVPDHLAHTKTFRHSYNDRAKLHGLPKAVRLALLGHRTEAANAHYGALIGTELREFAQQLWGSYEGTSMPRKIST